MYTPYEERRAARSKYLEEMSTGKLIRKLIDESIKAYSDSSYFDDCNEIETILEARMKKLEENSHEPVDIIECVKDAISNGTLNLRAGAFSKVYNM